MHQEKQDKDKQVKEKPKKHKQIKVDLEEFQTLKTNAEGAQQLQDKYMRLAAEVENFKKRVQKEKEDFVQFCTIDIFMQLLPIIDNFDRAYVAAKAHEHGEAFLEGVEMILKQLHKLLIDNGIEKVKTVGEKFDPHIHEAISTVESKEHPEDTVVEEACPGYTLNGKLIRAAKVQIAKAQISTDNKSTD